MKPKKACGVFAKYAQPVTCASEGAVTDKIWGKKSRAILKPTPFSNMKFKPIGYSDLNGKAKENYNFQKVSAILADYGFSTLRLSDDWQGADFIALKFDGFAFLKVQLKGRFEIAKKYEGKEIWVCFPFDRGLYLFPHDEILMKLKKEKSEMFRSQSWFPPDGKYHQKSPDKILQRLLEEHFYQPTKTMPNLQD